jgi:citrate lyase subunit beta-like protein
VGILYIPPKKGREWAVKATIAENKANQRRFAAWTLDRKMIDVLVAGKAKSIVEQGWPICQSVRCWIRGKG